MRHKNFLFGGAKIGAFLGWGHNVYTEEVYVLFCPLDSGSRLAQKNN